jgi:hypothetical protein
MTVVTIILSLLAIVGIGYGYLRLFDYAFEKYDFNIFGRGLLSIIPPVLASLGFWVVNGRKENYWQALLNKDLDVVIALILGLISFIFMFFLFLKETNWWISLLTMLLVGPVLIIILSIAWPLLLVVWFAAAWKDFLKDIFSSDKR